MRKRTLKTYGLILAMAVLVAACNGQAILVETQNASATGPAESGDLTGSVSENSKRGDVLSEGGAEDIDLGGSSGGGENAAAVGRKVSEANCATTSNPEQGFTADTLKLGTIIPLTGALRPLGEQTARVMRLAVQRINEIDKLPGPYPLVWGCPDRPGVYGRKLELEIFSLTNNTPEEALAGMRRLIDVENVFLVRDCYLQSNLMGPATQYQNSKGVPGVWCYFSEMKQNLAPWNYSPGIDPVVAAAINTGYAISKLKRERLAIVADPSVEDTLVKVVRRVAAHFDRPIPDDCIVYKKAQEASQGMRSEVAQIRTCYGATNSPDAVIALDALNAVFAAMEAQRQGWGPNQVQWVCTGLSCWITSLAELCDDACANMQTNCASLPCVPWASESKFPSVRNFNDFHDQYVPNEPEDILTYAPQAITSGIALWLTMTGPDSLSRENFVNTLQGLNNWSAGIGPTISIREGVDHFGAKSVWIIKYTGGGSGGFFDDVTGDFVTLQQVGVPESLTRV